MKAFFGNSNAAKGIRKAAIAALLCVCVSMLGMFFVSCGKKNETPPAEGEHEYVVDSIVSPTCVDGGYTVYKCVKCGVTKQDDFTEKTGHSFKNGECEFCHVKESVGSDEFYSAMYKSIAGAKGISVDIPVFAMEELINYYIIKDGEKVFDGEFADGKTDYGESKGTLYIDENGELAAKAHIVIKESSSSGYADETVIDAVLSGGYIYIKNTYICAEYTGEYSRETTFVKAEVNDIIGISSEISEEVGEYLEKAIAIIPEIAAKSDEFVAKGEKYGVKAIKLFIDMLFDGEFAESGITYTLNLHRLDKYVDMLANTKTSEIIDNIFGNNTTLKLTAFITASLEKTLPAVLSDLKDYGLDYEKILPELDKIALAITGEENYVTTLFNGFLAECGDGKLKTIISGAAGIDENDLTSMVGVIVTDIKELSPVELFVKYASDDEETSKEEIVETIRSAIERVSEFLNGNEISFRTDKEGNVLSFDVKLIGIEKGRDETDDPEGTQCDYYDRTNVTVCLVLDETNIPECDGVAEEYEAHAITGTPQSKLEFEFDGKKFVFVFDENGKFETVAAADGNMEKFGYVGMMYFGDLCCSPWAGYSVSFFKIDDRGSKTYEEYYFLFNYSAKEFVLSGDSESVYEKAHDFQISEEKSNLVCGGEKVKVCSKCGEEKTAAITHTGDKVPNYSLAFDGGKCTDGVIVTYKCSDCDGVISTDFRYSEHIPSGDSEIIDLSTIGKGCGSEKFVYNECLCGKDIYIDVVTGGSAKKSNGFLRGDEYALNEQETIEGTFSPFMHNGILVGGESANGYINREFTFKCGTCSLVLAYRVCWKRADGCKAELHVTLGFKDGDNFVAVKDKVYATKICHDYANRTEDGKEILLCEDCGSTVVKESRTYTDEEGRSCTEKTVTIVNTLGKGDKKRTTVSKTATGDDDYIYREEIVTTIDENGAESVHKSGRLHEAYEDIPEGFSSGDRIYVWNGDKSEETVYLTLETAYGTQGYVLFSCIKNGDKWLKYEFTHDPEGCEKTVVITDSDGLYERKTEKFHYVYTQSTVYYPTCTQYGYQHTVCDACGEELSGTSMDPYGHRYTEIKSDIVRSVCADCGTTEEYREIVLEDMTDYSANDVYAVGYYEKYAGRDKTYSLVLAKIFDFDEVYALNYGGSFDVSVDGLTGIVTFDKAADALAKAKLEELGLDGAEFKLALRIGINVQGNNVVTYKSLYDHTYNGEEIKVPSLIKVTVFGEERAEIKISACEVGTVRLASVSDYPLQAVWVDGENESEICYSQNNFNAQKSVEEDKEYELKVCVRGGDDAYRTFYIYIDF